jgi:hypothetical protein
MSRPAQIEFPDAVYQVRFDKAQKAMEVLQTENAG